MTAQHKTVVVIGNYQPDQQFSMNIYAHWLRELCATLGFKAVHLWHPPSLGLARHVSRKRWIGRWVDKTLVAPWTIPRADLALIADHANAVYTRFLRCPSIVVCHDLVPYLYDRGELLGWAPSRLGRMYLGEIANGLTRAQHIVCVSQQTRSDLERMLSIEPAAASTIPFFVRAEMASPADGASPEILRRLGLQGRGPLVLCFGGGKPYKNTQLSIDLFERAIPNLRAGATLVSIGKPSSNGLATSAPPILKERVVWADDVDDAGLRSLYLAAGALLFPSAYEGFGIPIIEAQALGLPVIAGGSPSLDEACGEGAIRINSWNSEEGAKALCRCLNDADFRKGLIEQGFRNAARFSFDIWVERWRNLLVDLGHVAPKPASLH